MRASDVAALERRFDLERLRIIRGGWEARRRRAARLTALPAVVCAGCLVAAVPLLDEPRSSGLAAILAVSCLGGLLAGGLRALAALGDAARRRAASVGEEPPPCSLLAVPFLELTLGLTAGVAAGLLPGLLVGDFSHSFRPQAVLLTSFLTALVRIPLLRLNVLVETIRVAQR
jgi:hypothetical protein